jgi:hypothetical protein
MGQGSTSERPEQLGPGRGGDRPRFQDIATTTARLAWSRRVADACLLAAGAMMLGVLLFVGRWLMVWQDEWDFVFGRQSLTLSSLFAPKLDTLLVNLSLVYQGLLAVFGLGTYLPFLLVTWLAHFVCVGLLYQIVARRSGVILGLMSGLSLLFLGSAFEVLLQPFQMQYLFAAAGGLLAIERLTAAEAAAAGHGTRDMVIAGLAMLFAIASSSLGPIFVGLLIVWALLRRDRGALIVTVPATLAYTAWYLTWGREGGQLPGAGLDLVQSVQAVLYGIGAAVSGLIGLPPGRFALVGLAIALLAAAAGVVAVLRGFRPDPLLVAALLALLAEYGLQTLFRGTFGVEHAARSGYIYPAVIFLWLAVSGIAGDRLSEARWRGRGRLALVPVLIGLLIMPMVIGNMRQFAGAASASRFLRATALAELRLVEAVRAEPGLALDVSPDPALLAQVTARKYLAAIDRFGAPTLDWDWTASVDASAVNAAALRLLGPAIKIHAIPRSTAAGPHLDVTGATTAAASELGCAQVIPVGGEATAAWEPARQTIWFKGIAAGRASLILGVIGEPSALLDGPPWDALLAGRAIQLPNLTSGYRWMAEVRSNSGRPFEVCAASDP